VYVELNEMLKVLGFTDLINSILLVLVSFNVRVPFFIVLIFGLLLLAKSFLNIFSLAGMIDFFSGIFLLSFLFDVNIGEYRLMLLVLALLLFLKGIKSILD